MVHKDPIPVVTSVSDLQSSDMEKVQECSTNDSSGNEYEGDLLKS